MSDRPDENDKSVKDQQRDDTLYDGFRPGGSTEEQSAEQGDKGLGSQQDSDLPDDFRPGENSKETKVEEHKRPGVGDIPEADVLSKAGEKPDKGGKTRAGREFEKHGRRYPEFWGQTKGMNAETYNKNGQEILDSIINSPDTQWNTRHHARFGNIVEGQLPDRRSARWSTDGERFICFCFLDPPHKRS